MNNVETLKLLCSFLNTSTDATLLQKRILANNVPWEEIISVANQEYIIPSLYISLIKKNIFNIISDEQLKEYLYTVYDFNLQRNQHIIYQIEDLVSILKPLNITPLLLKGAVSLCENDYTDLGMRHLTDIDMMIKPEQMKEAFNKLMLSGYSFVKETDINEPGLTGRFHHVKPISKNGMPSSVELHHSILVQTASQYMADYTNHVTKCSHKNLSHVDILSPTYRIYHAFLHTEIQDKNHKFRRITLRHLYDFTVLVNKYNNQIDWELLNGLVTKTNCKEILDDYLYLNKMFFSLETPLTVENKNTIKHYKKVLKTVKLQGTILENFYPLSAHIPKILEAYSRRRLHSVYSFDSNLGYFVAIFKRLLFHLKEMGSYFFR